MDNLGLDNEKLETNCMSYSIARSTGSEEYQDRIVDVPTHNTTMMSERNGC
jgi:hypothetical protein